MGLACAPMTRIDQPSEWLDKGYERLGMSQAEAVRAMRARGIVISESELSRWRGSRYVRSKKAADVYKFLFGGAEKPGPQEEVGLGEVVEELMGLRQEMDRIVADRTSEHQAMTELLAVLLRELRALRESVGSGASGADPRSTPH